MRAYRRRDLYSPGDKQVRNCTGPVELFGAYRSTQFISNGNPISNEPAVCYPGAGKLSFIDWKSILRSVPAAVTPGVGSAQRRHGNRESPIPLLVQITVVYTATTVRSRVSRAYLRLPREGFVMMLARLQRSFVDALVSVQVIVLQRSNLQHKIKG